LTRPALLLTSILFLFAGALLLSLNGCGVVTASPQTAKIQHVLVIVQENRTPDNLFQDPVLIGRGADIAQSGIDSKGNTIPLMKSDLTVDYDPDHSHVAFARMCGLDEATNQCRMDGADLVADGCNPGVTDCPGPNLSFTYVDGSEVQPYFQLAEQYTFGDRMFQTNQGPSMPAHQFLLSGTSAPTSGSNYFASENPLTSGDPDNGCDAPQGSTVTLINPAGNEDVIAQVYPCFEHQTLTDLLEAASLSWRYYTPSIWAIWDAPAAIQHICGAQTDSQGTTCAGTDFTNHVVLNQAQVLTDIADHQLQDVSWVIPSGAASDHPQATDGSGPSWVAAVVNAIGSSPYWADTVIFITWDDWGGWYDHVPPPKVLVNCEQWGCGYVYGFRVPLIVVSAYTKTGYISHVQHDFGSILKFVETTFNLPTLGYADVPADDFGDCFNFDQTPLTFHTISAPLNAQHFLNDKTPPTNPDND
jgi:phospholipase C